MATTKTIAIVGATGKMGSAIAKSLAGANGYRLLLMAGDNEKLAEVKRNIEAIKPAAEVDVITCAKDASWEADIIILATPYGAEGELAEKVREVATGKIVVSISNPLNSTFDDLIVPAATSAAEELQRLLPDSHVVKAFNTTFAADFERPVIHGERVDTFIAGNNSDAVEVVSNLVAQAGFNPVIAGDLSVSRTLERMQLLLIQLNARNNYNWMAGWKILHE